MKGRHDWDARKEILPSQKLKPSVLFCDSGKASRYDLAGSSWEGGTDRLYTIFAAPSSRYVTMALLGSTG
jgi:hypothetical protein